MKPEIKEFINKIALMVFIDLVSLIIGFATDMIYWTYWNNHKSPDQVGHGAPVFTFIGLIIGVIVGFIILAIYIVKVIKKKKTNENKEASNL